MKPGSLRFLLALTVVFYHTIQYVFIGYFAVHCFFILSGYWIAVMYDQKYSKFKNTLKVYFISRYWRLLPVFLLMVVAIYVLHTFLDPHFYDLINVVPGWVQVLYYGSNIFIIGYNQLYRNLLLLAPAWSLDIEIQFYILFPLLWLALKKDKYLLLLACISSAITFFLSTQFYGSVVSKTVIYYLPYFFIGILLHRYPDKFSKSSSLMSICLFIAVIAVHYACHSLAVVTSFGKDSTYNRFLNEILPLLIIPFIGRSVTLKSNHWDKQLGDMAYVLYFCHWFWLIPYTRMLVGADHLNKIIYLACYLLITLASTYLIYRYYDRPIDHLRRNWIDRQEKV